MTGLWGEGRSDEDKVADRRGRWRGGGIGRSVFRLAAADAAHHHLDTGDDHGHIHVRGDVRSGQGHVGNHPDLRANDPKARPNVILDRSQCTAVRGGWHAGGTVTNTGRTPTAYRLTVFFTSSHATVLSYAQTTVRADAGKTEKWSVSSTFAAPKSVICVLRGVATG